MGRFEVVVYPQDLDAAELAFARLGFDVVERFADGPDDQGVVFRLPADEVVVELVTHQAARELSAATGADTVAGLRLTVDDADDAWRAASAAGLRLDPVCASGPSAEPWGRLVRTYTAGGLRLDFLERPPGTAPEPA
jgi:hypothetical protein